MMHYLAITLLCAIPALLLSVFTVIVPRFRMEHRARTLLAQYPDVERTSVYLALHSTWAGRKKGEMDAKIEEMNAQGWTFLRAMEANPLRTIRSWGGGLTLHFIRTHDSKRRSAA